MWNGTNKLRMLFMTAATVALVAMSGCGLDAARLHRFFSW